MKKILTLVLALCMVLALAACGSSETPAGNNEEVGGKPANSGAET